jgi:hypothetical protein
MNKIIVEILLKHEDFLSDGYGFYSSNVEDRLLLIADEILERLGLPTPGE